jgi:hypothetical protein
MKTASSAILALALCVPIASAGAQAPAPAANPAAGVSVRAAVNYKISYVRIGNNAEALLYEPATPGPKERIGLVFSHPNRDTFSPAYGPELAARGYRVLTVNFKGDTDNGEAMPEAYLPPISKGVAFLRTLPGVQKVLLGAHSGGGHQMALYQNVAENGPGVCKGPEKVYPCDDRDIKNLQKADGVVFLDATLGAGHNMSAVDPAVTPEGRDASLDMFATQNGYDRNAKKGSFSADFAKKFYAAQAARNKTIVDGALARLKLIEEGKGQFSNDEPLTIAGIGVRAFGARLYQADTSILNHTKKPYLLLKADGTNAETVLTSVRPPLSQNVLNELKTLDVMNSATTVRHFLGASAIRTTAGYAFTADDITGIDWASAYTSTPNNVKGITVPAVIVSMSCHYLIVPDEIIFNNLASKDKTFAAVEGATHGFTPCRPEYGNTVKRLFDYVDGWISKEGRF